MILGKGCFQVATVWNIVPTVPYMDVLASDCANIPITVGAVPRQNRPTVSGTELIHDINVASRILTVEAGHLVPSIVPRHDAAAQDEPCQFDSEVLFQNPADDIGAETVGDDGQLSMRVGANHVLDLPGNLVDGRSAEAEQEAEEVKDMKAYWLRDQSLRLEERTHGVHPETCGQDAMYEEDHPFRGHGFGAGRRNPSRPVRGLRFFCSGRHNLFPSVEGTCSINCKLSIIVLKVVLES